MSFDEKMPTVGFAIALVGLSLSAGIVCAAEPLAPRKDDQGTLSLVWENDKITGTDRNYTNGMRLAWLSGTQPTDGVSRWLAKHVFNASAEALVRRGFAFGQSIFTPDNIEASQPQPNQHPYAGWLYGEYSLLIQQRDVVDRLSLQAGIVGPGAGGEWVQNGIHALVGVNKAQGWANQLGNEAGVVLAYDRKMRSLSRLGGDGLGADLTPNFGISVGNIYSNARVGVMARFGQDLRNDFGPPRVRPSLAGAGFFNPRDSASWYVFAGAEARAVAHNIFLDGSLFRDGGTSVNSKHFVIDYQVGVVAQFHDIQLSLTLVERSDEFEKQEVPQQFGALGFQRKF